MPGLQSVRETWNATNAIQKGLKKEICTILHMGIVNVDTSPLPYLL